MASLRSTYWSSLRLAQRSLQKHSRAAFSQHVRAQVAQNFVMPAMSPTMTEGNIAIWKLKEGDSFSAGDVLLEIETDKAQMDVEAQDDGILAKIIRKDGSKSVTVGSRIAILAEVGDDLATLQTPEEDYAGSSSEPARTSDVAESAPSPESTSSSYPQSADPPSNVRTHQQQRYPLYPAVEHLLHINGLSAEEGSKIPASGPSGRLLKGDVLAYLGKIDKSYPADQSQRISKLSHLNLSNIRIAKTPSKSVDEKSSTPASSLKNVEVAKTSELALPVSLASVMATQTRVKDSLGIFIPLSTLVARASELANIDLPASNRHLTSDDLFNAVLGLDKTSGKTSIGKYVPNMRSMLSTGTTKSKRMEGRKTDVIDYLIRPTGTTLPATSPSARNMAASSTGVENIFSVVVPKGDEVRAKVYLERMKTLLEADTGRLVL